MADVQLTARFVDGVASVPREAWDGLVGSGAPFYEWAFLRACEEHSARPERGVMPQHLTLWLGDVLVAACPLYVKGDGRAEFIYDWSWAQFAASVGVRYYPKLVAMPPFTPATCTHFLIAEELEESAVRSTMIDLVEEWARKCGLAGVHWLFVTDEEADVLVEHGHVRRLTSQLVLRNEGYASIDDFVGRMRSRHRIKFRRELRRAEENGLAIEIVEGDDLGERELDDMFRFYRGTCEAYGTGSQYLARGTWEMLFTDWRHRLVACFASSGGRRVGGSLCVQAAGELYGRYWGCEGHWPSLYFNLALHEPLKLMIERGWKRFHAGFGNAPYKQARGFDPEPTHSAHRLFDARLQAVLEEHLEEERKLVRRSLRVARAQSRLRGTRA